MILKTDRRELDRNIETSFLRSCDEVVGEMKLNAGVSVSRGMKLNSGDVQGGMRASVSFERTGRLEGRAGSNHRGAMMREKGGVILPVRRKLLSWRDPSTGKWIFARRVRQLPGFIRGRLGRGPWIEPAGDKFIQFMDDHLKSFG
jgi:hypothetical protein